MALRYGMWNISVMTWQKNNAWVMMATLKLVKLRKLILYNADVTKECVWHKLPPSSQTQVSRNSSNWDGLLSMYWYVYFSFNFWQRYFFLVVGVWQGINPSYNIKSTSMWRELRLDYEINFSRWRNFGRTVSTQTCTFSQVLATW